MVTDSGIKEKVSKIAERIIKDWNPKKIVLFGSYAHGKPAKDSDLDILIVTDRRLSVEEIYRMRRELVSELSVPVQLISVSDEEFLETKDVIGGIAYPASKYGEVLYEKS